jgi:microcystin-dependent protein
MSVKNSLGYQSFPLPIGAIIPWGFSNPVQPRPQIPETWRKCDGRYLDRATYPQLFEAIGTLYGTTTATNFRIPNLEYLGANVYPYVKGTAVNAGTFVPQTATFAPKTLEIEEIPALPDANFSDPVGATMANQITSNNGWLSSNGTEKNTQGLNSNCMGTGAGIYDTATATLTSIDVAYVNANPTPLDINVTASSIAYPAQSSIYLIKVYYEEPVVVPSNIYVQSPSNNPFPPNITDPVRQISGFRI